MAGTQNLTPFPLYGIEEPKDPNYHRWGNCPSAAPCETAVGKTAAKTSAGASGILAGC